MQKKQSFSELLQASLKSKDTEETIDIYFNRPVGLAIALICKSMHIHPNAITVFSFFVGAAGGWLLFYHDLWLNLLGILLLMIANFCDSADGQLARLTGQKTLVGRVLDGFAGDVWYTFIYLAIIFRLWNEKIPFTDIEWGVGSFILCFIAGVLCHSKQSSLADYYRQIHLYFLLGKKGSELDDSKTQRAIYDALPKWREFWAHAFYYNYANYCKSQEKRTPKFQALYAALRKKYPNAEDMPQQLRDEFRAGSLPLMKYTNWLTHNSRAFTLYIVCLLNVPYIYPLFEIIVLGVMYLYMHRKHEELSERMMERL